MARMRMIKPEFFQHEGLADLSFEARLGFIGLWTLADREGRLEDRPKRIRASLFPYDDVDVEQILAQLDAAKFIQRYTANEIKVIGIPSFSKHQHPHHREPASELPEAQALGKARPRRGLKSGVGGLRHGLAPDQPDGVGVGVGVGVRQIEFDDFWREYTRKVAKLDAERAWSKILVDERPAVMAGLAAAKRSEQWRRDGGKYVPYPATWLNGRRWEDDPELPADEPASAYAGTKEWLTCTRCQQDYCRVIGKPDEHVCAVAV